MPPIISDVISRLRTEYQRGPIRAATNQVGRFNDRVKNLVSPVRKLNIGSSIMNNRLSRTFTNLKSASKAASYYNTSIGKVMTYTRKTGSVIDAETGKVKKSISAKRGLGKESKALRGTYHAFRGELLSAMFIAMAMSRTLNGMITPVLELTGVFDMWNATLIDLFLPVLLPLSDILFWIMDWFMNLPEPVKNVIAIIILIAAVFFALMVPLTMLALLFSSVGIGIVMGIGLIVAAFLIFAAGIALIIGGIIKIWKNWGENWSKVVDGLIMVLVGLAAIIGFIFGGWLIALILAAAALFLWLGKKIVQWLNIEDQVKAVWEKILGFFEYVVGKIADLFKWLWSKISHPIETIKGIGGWAAGLLGGRQVGGIIPKTGPYMLHAGEAVSPAGFTAAPTVNVYATVGSDIDVRRLASQLSTYWISEMDRYARTRGMI